MLSGAAGFSAVIPESIQAALTIDPKPGSSFLDAEHVVILMQENRSFDHSFGTLQGVRGFNDPRAIDLPNGNPVWFQENEEGETFDPFRLDIKNTKITWMGDLPHSRASQVDAHNNGKYDNWLPSKKSGKKKYANLPLTMGYYTREDLPFYYALADAFTVCDQNFCSAMTSTTPNRSMFWTANIQSEENGLPKANIRNTDYAHAKHKWPSFPELLSKHDIDWKFYQNEITCGGGFKGEERSWLANFGCNLLEFFAAYNVKFAPMYIQGLQNQVIALQAEIENVQTASPGETESDKTKAAIQNKQKALNKAMEELKHWNMANFEKLSDAQKQLFANAFVTNINDPEFRKLTTLQYDDQGKERELKVPAGDIFYQFRKDVKEGKLPTVSWMAGPQNFSDHPSAPWYGAWYLSEIMDILTKNPDVWRKTIFIVTYDENDGYYDHIPPFSISDNKTPGTGKCAPAMDTEKEFVRLKNELMQGIPEKQAREAPIGLGFRVPMIIASPWSRGGKVCSQIFEHTSTLQFLEVFCSNKFNKKIHFDNINPWRRSISGNLTSSFSIFKNAPDRSLAFLNRNKFIETIYNAKFRNEPTGFNKVGENDLKNGNLLEWLPEQEPGTRPACALPYQLFADGKLDVNKEQFSINMEASSEHFGAKAAGAPFRVYAIGNHKALADNKKFELNRNWNYSVAAGNKLSDQWQLADFERQQYQLRLYGPNGFFREFKGDRYDPDISVFCGYQNQNGLTGNIEILISNEMNRDITIEIKDRSYGNATVLHNIPAGKNEFRIVLNLKKSSGWYDYSIKLAGFDKFSQKFAGHVDTGLDSNTDPAMGRVK